MNLFQLQILDINIHYIHYHHLLIVLNNQLSIGSLLKENQKKLIVFVDWLTLVFNPYQLL
jgi:hypothetical protein